jgi:hypothetical protein
MSYLDTVISHGDAPHETGEPCCGACGYAAEIERAGGPASVADLTIEVTRAGA